MQNQLAMSELSLLHSQFPHLAQWVKLKLENGEEVEGQIFTYDKISNVVVLQQKCKPENGVEIPGTHPKYNFRIVKISYIKEISIPSTEKKQLLLKMKKAMIYQRLMKKLNPIVQSQRMILKIYLIHLHQQKQKKIIMKLLIL
ncbi:hypothetical protein BCR36DRAFT_68928 [Piromyces finnis]|uniref:LSM domain-containing protein n=1 Tax=Piromyces finnis TaxID=1754191 RepID=A0A1Y1V869_9FUNG|nr:hypothetical protein BCR36DRAFT_68928 [Piromyces finnis]|eukprot:ORX49368.1 hypothetical protein BCR36DRAFT_68928 [Piromyces finnis]